MTVQGLSRPSPLTDMRTIFHLLIGLTVGIIISVGVVIPGQYVHSIDAEMPSESYMDSIIWLCPVFDDNEYVVGHVRIKTPVGLTYDDLKDSWDNEDAVRRAYWNHGYTIPDCPTSFLSNLESSLSSVGLDIHICTDRMKCLIIQSFVVNGIGYAEDVDQFGCKDFALTPLETLYLGKGDCEDVSILFVSIARAYGLDAVLILYDEHCVAGVRLDGYKDTIGGYVPIECTFSWAELYRPSSSGLEDMKFERIVTDDALDRLASSWARYSNRIADWNPILFIIRTLS